VDLDSWSRMIQQSGLPDPLLDQFVQSSKIGRPAVLIVALRLHWVVLEGCDLSQELLVDQSQFLLLLENVLAIGSQLFPFTV